MEVRSCKNTAKKAKSEYFVIVRRRVGQAWDVFCLFFFAKTKKRQLVQGVFKFCRMLQTHTVLEFFITDRSKNILLDWIWIWIFKLIISALFKLPIWDDSFVVKSVFLEKKTIFSVKLKCHFLWCDVCKRAVADEFPVLTIFMIFSPIYVFFEFIIFLRRGILVYLFLTRCIYNVCVYKDLCFYLAFFLV